jgi:hypothetical protein
MSNRQRDFILISLALVICRSIGSITLPVYGDAFITFRYAKNLAQGLGFVYQPRQWVLGVTSPAFGILIALFPLIKMNLPTAVVALNIILDIFTLVLTLRCIGSTAENALGVIFGIFFSLSPVMTRICVGGMEMNLFLFASVLAMFLYDRGFKRWAICLAAVSYFIRPESLVLVVILLCTEGLGHGWRSLLRLVVWIIVIIVPGLIILQFLYGTFFPQSVISKSREIYTPLIGVLKELIFSDILCLIVMPLAIYGGVKVFRRNRFLRMVTLWGVGYAIVYLVVRPHVWSWYGEPVHYVEFVLAAVGITELLRRIKLFSRVEFLLSSAGSILVVVIWSLIFFKVGSSRITGLLYHGIEGWCNETNIQNRTLLAEDIGCIGFYSSAQILDVAGLVWPPAIEYRSDREIMDAYKPDYLFLTSTRQNVEMMITKPWDTLYVPVRRFSSELSATLSMDPSNYDDAWKQDYLLFARVKIHR